MTRVRSVTGLACSVRFPREWCSDRGLALAPRAECRRPQVDRVRGDELLAAPHTRLATPAVHLQLELEPAFLPGAGAVIAHRGWAVAAAQPYRRSSCLLSLRRALFVPRRTHCTTPGTPRTRTRPH